MKAYDVKIKLNNFNPLTYRQILLPDNITFAELDDVLKTIWGFKGLHLSKFSTDDELIIMDDDFKSDYDIDYDSKQALINDIFKTYDKINYCYDFSEKWEFLVEIIDEIDYDKDYVTIKNFEGKWNLMEDCGGVYNYSRIIYYKKHPEVDMISTLNGMAIFLEEFDMEHVQDLLKHKNYVKFQFK